MTMICSFAAGMCREGHDEGTKLGRQLVVLGLRAIKISIVSYIWVGFITLLDKVSLPPQNSFL